MSTQGLPLYLPSNMTVDEIIRTVEPFIPGYITRTMEELKDEAAWATKDAEDARKEMETSDADNSKRVEELEQQLDEIGVHARDLEAHWLELKPLIPKTKQAQHAGAIEMIEYYIATATKVVP